jgi:hypothetical protein
LRLRVTELRGINDIATMSCEKTGNAMNDAATIWASEGENIFWVHNTNAKMMAKKSAAAM